MNNTVSTKARVTFLHAKHKVYGAQSKTKQNLLFADLYAKCIVAFTTNIYYKESIAEGTKAPIK